MLRIGSTLVLTLIPALVVRWAACYPPHASRSSATNAHSFAVDATWGRSAVQYTAQEDKGEESQDRTHFAATGGGVCRRAAGCREAVFDVLHALGLVGVREPVLAHVEVVGEADAAAGHEDLGDGEAQHGGLGQGLGWGGRWYGWTGLCG